MSDQQARDTGVVLDLEELFLAREFGRGPAWSVSTAPATVASEPAQLEEVFLSDVFGHPEVVAAAVRVVEESAPARSGRPTLVLLRGGGEGAIGRDTTHHRAIAAVSGVAAAALAVAGLASETGQGPGRAPVTEQAQGAPNPAQTGSVGALQPGPVAPALPLNSSSIGTSAAPGGGGTNAALTSFTTPVAAGSPQGATGGGVATPPATPAPAGGGTSPGAPAGGGGGSSVLQPALNVVGNEVTSVGTSVSSTAGDVGQALPVASVIQAVGSVATSVDNNLGGGTPPNILGVSKQ
jgi:hypothetical protein